MRVVKLNIKQYSALTIVALISVSIFGYLIYKYQHRVTTVPAVNQLVKENGTPKANYVKYFTISEMGVRAPYSSSDKLTYKFFGKSVLFKSEMLTVADALCDEFGTAGGIERFEATDGINIDGTGIPIAEYIKDHPGSYTYVEGYYYKFIHAQAQCGNVSFDIQQEANDTVKDLVTHLQSVAN